MYTIYKSTRNKNATKRLKINYIFLFSPFTPDIIITHEYSTQLFYYNSQKSIETSTKRCLNSCIEEINKEKEEILPLPREATKQTHRKRRKNQPSRVNPRATISIRAEARKITTNGTKLNDLIIIRTRPPNYRECLRRG